jgi:hypothetical protein|tara:strand:+ start:132 stop:404 length:273 start_codon:yes stop_codon:yes gene_type:complete
MTTPSTGSKDIGKTPNATPVTPNNKMNFRDNCFDIKVSIPMFCNWTGNAPIQDLRFEAVHVAGFKRIKFRGPGAPVRIRQRAAKTWIGRE